MRGVYARIQGAAADTTTADECAACAGTSGTLAETAVGNFAEAAEARRPPYEGLRMRAENAVNAFYGSGDGGARLRAADIWFSHWDSGNAGRGSGEQ